LDFIKILGCGSALPFGNRYPSAQIIKNREHYLLIDCGEGTQLRIREAKISFNRITHIFITHLHGDHFFGLPGLLSSFHLLGRIKDVKLYGPKGLMEILELQFKLSGTTLRYQIVFTEISGTSKKLIMEDSSIEVYSFPLNHRIRCHGYFFQEKKKPATLLVDKIKEYSIPDFLRNNIKGGADFEMKNGRVIPHKELTTPAPKPISFAYCSDNRIKEKLKGLLQGVDYLYHETTFMETEKDRAKKTYHSTASEAAMLAKDLGVKKLIIGHYSARYQNLKPLLQECLEVFEHTVLGYEGFELSFTQEGNNL
jgi:ribonuclease Z